MPTERVTTLAGKGLECTVVVSCMRRDVALYESARPRSGKRGRPRTKGKRLPTPAKLSTRLETKDFTELICEFRGRKTTKLVWSTEVLWYRGSPKAMVRLVVRDPTGREPNDFLFTTDLAMSAVEVIAVYVGRWGIKMVYRAT